TRKSVVSLGPAAVVGGVIVVSELLLVIRTLALGVKVVKKVAKSDLDSDLSIRLRFGGKLSDFEQDWRLRFAHSCVLSNICFAGCVLSWTAFCRGFVFCQALRFAHLKTNYCVLLRTTSAKIKTALRFASEDCVLKNLATNGKALRKCILSGPYKPTTILVQAVEATDDSPAVPEHTTEMWEAIERLQQGESLNIQDAKTNLFWEFRKFTSHNGESMESYYTRFYKLMNEMIRNNLTVTTMQVNIYFLQQLQPEWSRFMTIVKQQHKLDEVSYHKLFDILKQYQNEVNELRAEKLARNANPLALVATAQASQDPYYQTSRSHRSSAPLPKPLIPSRSHMTTRHKGKEIAKPITPPSKTASEEDNDPEQAQRDKDTQNNLALIAKYFKKIYKPTNNNLRTSSNSKNKNVDTTPRFKNDNQSGQSGNQRTVNVVAVRENAGSKDSVYHKEKMLLCKQAEQGVPLQAEQYDWLADTDEEVDEQELEAHYSYMAKIQKQSESVSNTCLVETDDSNVTPDSPYMCEDDIQNEQNDVESDDERVALANLIANLKLDVDENRKIQKQLKKANTTLAQELKECKAILAKITKSLGESISVRDSCLVALQTKQAEFEKFKAFNDHTIDYDKLKYELRSDKAEFSDMYDAILQECVSKDVMCSYSMSLSDLDALDELQCLYLHKVKECDCLAQKLSKQTKSISKKVHTKLLQRFAKVEKHSISFEIAL
nr:hypothetical protein [Tanacetum cinerariifolium]